MTNLFRSPIRRRSQEGAAAVEFALIASILFMVLFGIIEFGRLFSELEVLNSAAREGARVAAVRGTGTDVADAVEQAAQPYDLDEGPTADKVCNDSTSGQPVTVAWDQNFQFSVGLLPDFNQTMEIKGVFRCE
jgi:Flp pilus assembly protein TadG